ncbi:hypothetical protein LTS08_008133 [Lithohypha guttulata]|nr:hypothetical protein LTS08_008133 [Lithohypha guttulata]
MPTTSREFITAVLTELNRVNVADQPALQYPSSTTRSSRLAQLKGKDAEQARSTFLTLHFLFPHELLPALDLLDRKLVKRFRCSRPSSESPPTEVFYIQSASAVTASNNRRSANSRFRNAWKATKIHYEVRLDSWNCSCAAFAQAELKMLLARAKMSGEQMKAAKSAQRSFSSQMLFGGTTTRHDAVVPTCKHILAAIIGTAAPKLFGDGIDSKDVSKEELAAWAAGWGEA